MIVQSPRHRVRPDHRRLGQLDSLPGSLVARVRQVDKQPEAVQLRDQLPPQVRQAVALVPGRAHGLPEPRGARERAVAHVCEADVADAQLREQADRRQGVAEEVCPLHAEQAGDLARLECGAYVLRRAGVLEVVRVRGYHLVDEVEDLQGVAEAVVGDVVVGADFDAQEVWAWCPNGPEGCAEAAFPEAGDVDVAWSIGGKVGKYRDWTTVWQ